ncbi:MAG: hypothetical protein HUJ56_12490 [Erysipelotrichaceae bacterium]|nr:hypothetical protein [Erysipelotrichaceae bacterium]
MDFIKRHKKDILLGMASIFLFVLFYYMSSRTPLAGDDWGYANQGSTGNPFYKAYQFYFSWSGRYFSELWGFIVAPRKWLWNILNPALFTGIYIGIIKLINPKKNYLFSLVLVMALMLSVENTLRIETYTWIMGTTYVVPLFWMIWYLVLIKPVVLEDKQFSVKRLIVCGLMNLYITLCMENIAAVLILANILLVGYIYFTKKRISKEFMILLVISIIGFIILRASPGAAYRLKRDNVEFNELSLLGKFMVNWVWFLNYTFVSNQYLLMGLSSICLLGHISRYLNHEFTKWDIVSGVFHLIAIFASLSGIVYDKLNISVLLVFFDIFYSRSAMIFCSVFYLAYIVIIWMNCVQFLKKSEEGIFYLMLAGTGNLVMLVSPIFGARSSLYTVYFIIILGLLLVSEIEISKPLYILGVGVCCALCLLKVKEFYYKYRQVHAVQLDRESKIAYYQDHWEDTDIYLPRMPEGYLHSADIELDDDYHMEVFKTYYHLNPEADVQFYR